MEADLICRGWGIYSGLLDDLWQDNGRRNFWAAVQWREMFVAANISLFGNEPIV
jgi:hypothetical protein